MATCGEFSFYADKSETERVWFRPGEEVPGWAVKQVGKHCLSGGGDKPKGDEPQAQADADEAPPRSGKGSGTEEWSKYAQDHGVTVDDDMSRDDIIGACEDAGVVD